ncbi:MAG: LLM class flavin-dependent oxidoreductase [Acidimicrobiaceae bacterium]|nr:LLM class flavin-dependent oxidoreductase [Acidimicrobiaceae bacterium]MYA13599.1 LLM class flavin-dependent oxidoreductase [Acidimicrobiaceae bacterium]MYE55836.1 LLM class flavin-dependent oxidoreductase [Acidimicrobiaceae bacterium]
MDFGWRVPSYAGPLTTPASARALVPYFARVEEAGFSGLWVIDHLLVAPNVYSVAWQDPMITLAVAAGATERIRLGTAILCAPFRHPTIIAKEVASLDSLSGGGRVVLGVGTGHDDMEFASVGVPRRERGRRTDEALELIGLLLSSDGVNYEGTYYRVDDGTTLYPRPEQPIPVWIGGGSQVHVVDNVDTPNMAPAVLARIGRHDGWICRSSGTSPEIVAGDIASVRGYLEARRDMSSFTMSHAQWLHIVDSADRDKVIAEQLAAYRTVMDVKRSDADLQNAYLFGTIDEMTARIRALAEAGIDHLIINPLTNDPRQIDLFADKIMANV